MLLWAYWMIIWGEFIVSFGNILMEIIEGFCMKSNNNKNGVLWSQARMRIEMRLKCYLVI